MKALKSFKKQLILFSLIFLSLNVMAQLEMNSNGDVMVGATSPSGKLFSYFNDNYAKAGSGLFGSAPTKDGKYRYGTKGVASSSKYINSGRSYGVWGGAGNATKGYNYGVYGVLLGKGNGAGVFGTTKWDVEIPGKYAGYFNGPVKVIGNITATGSITPSDINLKKDIRKFEKGSSLKICQLNAITYKLKNPNELAGEKRSMSAKPGENPDSVNNCKLTQEQEKIYNRERIGLSAQELKEVYPELVVEDQDGTLGVDYIGLIPVLIEALKEQQIEINNLKDASCSKLTSTNNEGVEEIASYSKLFQNKPNPFTEQTTIDFYISDDVKSVKLCIYDLTGKQIKDVDVIQRGSGSIIFYANEFQPGMYKYCLIADGNIVGTETMILLD